MYNPALIPSTSDFNRLGVVLVYIIDYYALIIWYVRSKVEGFGVSDPLGGGGGVGSFFRAVQ